MSDREPEIETLFLEALAKDRAEDREAYLREKCGDDIELRKQVETLLAARLEMGGFMGESHSQQIHGLFHEQPGSTIGPYQLLKQIGEGGMGIVFIAEQREPVKRHVALKIIQPGMNTRQVMARFEAERQALAMMNHPHIAKVLDAGETGSGRPYFVMELVDGVAITEFCDQNKLTSRERMQLFTDVCSAIQHAHQKGVIHRDVKPSNVLVSMHDEKPVVKVIDFGVAKAIHQPLTDKTVYTEVSQLIGTPLYMSPEQAGLSGTDVDTRTDIYSLGVLLYELLTGTTPFDRHQLRQAAQDEMRRIIREQEPPRPSTRISTLGEQVSDISQHRRTDPQRLRQSLRGDIDWIVMKAIEKERDRRYESADALAMDIQRHLREEPVLACPPSTAYRLRKFVRRNRAGVIAASLIAIALILGLIGSGSGLAWALREKKRASDAAEVAVAKEKTSRRILEFLVSMFEEANPGKRMGEPMTVQEFLDVGAERIDELDGEPDALATLQETIGTLYIMLSEYGKSEPLLQAAHDYRKPRAKDSGQNEQSYASVLASLAALYQWTDEARAERYARQASLIFDRLLGESPELADSLNLLGNALQRQQKIPPALAAHFRSLEIRKKLYPPGHPDHHNVATALHNIGIAYFFDRNLPEAEKYFVQSIAIEEEYCPPNDPGLATAKHVLSIVYANQSKFENARKWQQQSFEIRSRVFPDDHDHVGLSNNWMGNIYRGLKRYTESEPMLRRALEIHTRVYGDDHDLVLWDKQCLLKTLIELEKFDEALQLQHELQESTKDGGDGFVNSRSVGMLLGDIFYGQNRIDESQAAYQATIDLLKGSDNDMDRSTAIAQLKLLAIEVSQGKELDPARYGHAVEFLIEQENLEETDAQLLQLHTNIADALMLTGKKELARPIYESLKSSHLEVVKQANADPFLVDSAARFMLTCHDRTLRDPKIGLELAQRACDEAESPDPQFLATLALAERENGMLSQAVKSQRSAIELLPSSSWWHDRFVKELNAIKQLDNE